MADIKTHLRELSVATTIGLLKDGISFDISDLYDSRRFFSYAQKVISGSIASAQNLSMQSTFTGELRQIIDNGYRLGKTIYEMPYFQISKSDSITWQGNDTQKEDPVDITVGRYGFSLKEESFILENMGLYKLLNCYTGSNYKKRHIFSDYARKEYENWFAVTWNELVKYLMSHSNVWTYNNSAKKKSAKIELNGRIVTLQYSHAGQVVAKSVLPINCTLGNFEAGTTSKTREEVFSKFINQNLDNNQAYNTAKKVCAVVATEALAKELNDNLDYNAGLPRFLRIHDSEYYYAKTTVSGIDIFKVPSKADFGDNIYIESIVSSVPDKQANILTTIRNRKTGKKLVLRNECRFSHGQFNGTPEAKMYYEHGGSLLVIYEPVEAGQKPPTNSFGRTIPSSQCVQRNVTKVEKAPVSRQTTVPQVKAPKPTTPQMKPKTTSTSNDVTADDLRIGMVVTHIVYGDGRIKKIDRSNDYVYVQFPSSPRDVKTFIIKSVFGKGILKIK